MKTLRFLIVALLTLCMAAACTDDGWNTQGPSNQGGQEQPDPDPDPDPDPNEPTEYPFISTDPAFVTEDMTTDVKVIINGKGTVIEGFKGDLYAHTGVITDKSTASSDWKYVKADWNVNIDACKLASKGNNIWELTIKGGPRAYYGVPAGDKILKLAFVFRSADGSTQLKDNGNDIFIDLVEEGLSVLFVTPADGLIMQVGDKCEVQVKQQEATSVTLYNNE